MFDVFVDLSRERILLCGITSIITPINHIIIDCLWQFDKAYGKLARSQILSLILFTSVANYCQFTGGDFRSPIKNDTVFKINRKLMSIGRS